MQWFSLMKTRLTMEPMGLLQSVSPAFKSKLLDAFLESAPEVGMKFATRPIATSSFREHRSRLQRREHEIFCWTIFMYSNLTTKISINGHTKTAYGVEFGERKSKRRFLVKEETIVSAGTYRPAMPVVRCRA